MKKLTLLAAFICALAINSNAGTKKHSIRMNRELRGHSSGCISQGNSLVDIYYGFPNLYAATIRSVYSNAGYTDVKVSSIGPVGVKYEYILSEKFGMGGEINYSSVTLSQKYDGYDPNTGNPAVYTETLKSPAIRAMVTFNFHFVNTEKVDVYGAVKTGYYNRTFTDASDEPGYQGITIKSLVPVAFRLEVGMRYFFTDNIGIHVNVGLGGGPIMAAGLALKF